MANDDSDELIRLREQVRLLEGRPEQTPAASTALSDHDVYKVSFKLPPFVAHKPTIWFAQVEHQFAAAYIRSDDTKFHYLAGLLDAKLAAEVEDIIVNPPPTNKYQTLKEELIKRLSLSQEQRLRQLLGDVELGDMKPSQFFRHLQSLAGPEMSDEKLLRQLWLRRLPVQTKTVLTALAHLPISEVVDIADKIVEVSQPRVFATSPVRSALPNPSHPHQEEVIGELKKCITDMTKIFSEQIASLSSLVQQSNRQQFRGSSPSRNRGRRSRSPSPGPSSNRCWYHRSFGDRARKCISPCDWTPGNAPRSQQ